MLITFLRMNIELIGFIKDGKYRIKVLNELLKRPLLSSELANILNINRASMSRILSIMTNKGVIKSNSNSSRTVVYEITKLGKDLSEEIK